MLRNNKRNLIITSAVILLPVLAGLILWDELPARMATHWGADGAADGWSGRALAVFGLPLFVLALHWVCVFFTVKDPKNRNQNRKVFGMVLWICPLLSVFAAGVIYAAALGKEFDMELAGLLLIGLMFVAFGNYLPKCRQNVTIGIKLKWTLVSEENWNVTHRLGGRVWVTGGLLIMACIFLPEAVIPWALIVLLPVIALVPVVYSYAYYRKQAAAGTVPPKAVVPMGRWSKAAAAVVCVLVGIVLAGGLFFARSAGFEIAYGETAFTVDASGWSDVRVEYQAIEALEYRDSCAAGERTHGFGPAPVQMGTFENSEFGSYTRYTHAGCEAAVVLRAEGKILVVGGVDEAATKAIYAALTARR